MIKLKEIFVHTELATTIHDYYNSINTKEPITTDFCNKMMESINFSISKYLELPTDFKTIDEGKEYINIQLKVFGIGLVIEYKNYFKSLNENLAVEHRQSKFNPLNNDNIENASVKTDDTVFTLGSQMYAATEFIIRNRRFTHHFLKTVLNHTVRVF